eukprot:TRINITY_DN22745_c0_g1_i1.p1 TRINITY_DN22745_c0_g1~~TRINITY_DN22745_c0_g1_i1.p1  ORF type:complete len:380 (+),score=87.64 TRINITY_DN22745_c0_g1_i1:83-1222(+)
MILRSLLVAVCGVLCGASWVHENDGQLYEQDVADGKCLASLTLPAPPRPLEFCQWHTKRSCCAPPHDNLAMAFFSGMAGGTSLGLGCASAGHTVKHLYLRLRYLACFACDPIEPKIRFNIYDGYEKNNIEAVPKPPTDDLVVIVNGTEYPVERKEGAWLGNDVTATWANRVWTVTWVPTGDVLALSEPSSNADIEQATWSESDLSIARNFPPMKFKWRVCRSFVDKLWNASGAPYQQWGKIYDKCGLMWADDEGNPYVVMPSRMFLGETGGEDFMRFVAQGVPNFNGLGFDFVVVDDVLSNNETCFHCTVRDGMCHDCPNGCRYDSLEGVCKAFDFWRTPCFFGEDTPLPDRPESLAAGVLDASIPLLLAALAAVGLGH